MNPETPEQGFRAVSYTHLDVYKRQGFIERIKFRNEENGYTVMSVTDQSDGEEVIMVGNLAYAAEGDMIEASGHMTQHPVYGEQLQIESYEMKTPQDELSMERYLGSGAIKGIGAALAARIDVYKRQVSIPAYN